MSRFITLANNVTNPGSFGPAGVLHRNPQDGRGLMQFVSSGGFTARIYGTLDFDFETNVGSNWTDITDRFRTIGASDADWVLVGSSYQKRKQDNIGLPIQTAGIYAMDSDYCPAAVFVGVSQVSSGFPLKVVFGF